MNKMTAEFIGTFTLVLFGCGAAVIAGWASAGVDAVAARGEALMAWLRQELLEAPKGAGGEP